MAQYLPRSWCFFPANRKVQLQLLQFELLHEQPEAFLWFCIKQPASVPQQRIQCWKGKCVQEIVQHKPIDVRTRNIHLLHSEHAMRLQLIPHSTLISTRTNSLSCHLCSEQLRLMLFPVCFQSRFLAVSSHAEPSSYQQNARDCRAVNTGKLFFSLKQ